jgi:hypothetical protein
MSRPVAQRYRTTIILACLVLGLAHAAIIVGYDLGTGLISEKWAEWGAGFIAAAGTVLLPAGIGVDGTRYYRDPSPRARTWWQLGAMVAAIVGAVAMALGVIQGVVYQAQPGSSGGTFTLVLLLGYIIGIWSGAFMGWIGNLLGRLTIRLGI